MFEAYPDILSIAEVQNALRLSRNTVLKLLDTGQINYTKIGKLYRIPKESLEEYIKQNSNIKKEN